MSDSPPTTAEARRLARDARDRVRFEEEALELSDQVYRVARRLVGTREEAEDLVRATVGKDVVNDSPKVDGDTFDEYAVKMHYGLIEVNVVDPDPSLTEPAER